MGFYLLDHAQPNTQQWGYPRRGAQLSGTCIIHTAECAADTVGPDGSAEGTAEFIRTRSDYGSYHTVVDSDSIIEMVPYEYEAWQDSETNPWAVGISAAVQADHWDAIPAGRRDATLRNMARAAADFVTYMASKGITVPLRRISGAQARARVPGFCAHGDSGIDRHDPGVQFDWAKFFNYTRQALSGSAAVGPQSGTITPISKEWDEMATPQQIHEAVWGPAAKGENGAPFIYNNALKRSEYPRTVLGALQDRVVNEQIKPLRQAVASQDAQIKALVGAVAAMAKGDAFDEAKLLAGVQAAAEAGVKAGIQDGAVTVDVNVNGGK